MKFFDAFALNVRPYFTESVPDRLNLLTGPGFTCGGSSNIPSAQVHANHLGCLACGWSVYLYYKVDVVVTFLRLAQSRASQGLTPKQCNLITTNGQLEVYPSTLQRHPNNLFSFHIAKCANIQTNRRWSELVDLLNGFGIANHPADCLADMVSFQPRRFSHWLIDFVVKLGCVPAIVSFSYCQYLIASISKSPQSLINFWLILCRDYKLALYRQGLSHNSIVTHPARDCGTRLVSRGVFPPRDQAAGFQTTVRFFMMLLTA